jgi:hypothetical protein
MRDPGLPATPPPLTGAQWVSQAPFGRQQAVYDEAVHRKASGMPLQQIAATLGHERKTVRR